MPRTSNGRTIFGSNKYAAYHLLLARWLRHYAEKHTYCYVSLGGTELRDLQNVLFIDPTLASPPISIELDPSRHSLAEQTAQELLRAGIVIDVRLGNLFEYRRKVDVPHVFFIDLPGTCAWADYHVRFAEMFQDERIQAHDAVFISSYLGRNPGWHKVFENFSGEFNILGITDPTEKKHWYKRAHPSFTLFRGLSYAKIVGEVSLRCFGCVEYYDSSTMGVYGYTVADGQTTFTEFIRNTPYFDLRRGYRH